MVMGELQQLVEIGPESFGRIDYMVYCVLAFLGVVLVRDPQRYARVVGTRPAIYEEDQFPQSQSGTHRTATATSNLEARWGGS